MDRRALKTLRPSIGTLGPRLGFAPGTPSRQMVARLKGRRLQQAREELFKRQPLCVLCLEAGRVEPATERDHIVPLALGGADDEGNTRGLCTTCNRAERNRVFGWAGARGDG